MKPRQAGPAPIISRSTFFVLLMFVVPGSYWSLFELMVGVLFGTRLEMWL